MGVSTAVGSPGDAQEMPTVAPHALELLGTGIPHLLN
jgi:hypothetical protein